jgi:hypothetical protein
VATWTVSPRLLLVVLLAAGCSSSNTTADDHRAAEHQPNDRVDSTRDTAGSVHPADGSARAEDASPEADAGPHAAPDAPGMTVRVARFALVEHIRADVDGMGRDVIYSAPRASHTAAGYLPTAALGLALPPKSDLSQTIALYRCAGQRFAQLAYHFSYFSTDASCAGHPFVNGGSVSAGVVARIYTPDLDHAKRSGKIALYRYWLVDENGERTPLLSTTAPEDRYLAILRYERDPLLGNKPLGYLDALDSQLDGNSRWLLGLEQQLCYGIASYQPSCPSFPGPLRWSVLDLASATEVLDQTTHQQGMVTLPASAIAALERHAKVKPHRPLLLRVEHDGILLAAKNVRLVRTPFVAQYSNNIERDDDGEPSNFPTSASALLLANQLTAHRSFTDPLAARAHDPALFDGIVYVDFYAPEVFGRPRSGPAMQAKQQHGFRALDHQGILVGAEAAYSFFRDFDRGSMAYPFDAAQAISAEQLLNDSWLIDNVVAESFDVATGQFYKRLPRRDSSGRVVDLFYPDFSRKETLEWLLAGVAPYMDRLHRAGIPIAFFSFSENALQVGGTHNNSRLPYPESPTFSEAAFRAFASWLRAVSAPAEFVALPVLPEHYERAQRASTQALHRIQPADPASPLWNYWAVWRRDIFNRAIGRIARALKQRRESYAYRRAPLQLIAYNWVDWVTINGKKFDSLTSSYWDAGYRYDPTAETIYVDSGQDYELANRLVPGSIDYLVHEVKWLPDDLARGEIQRMLDLKAATRPAAKIGLHVELEAPQIDDSDYMTSHMRQIFPTSFRTPAFDLVWAWEAQCEYVLSMKQPDPSNNERLDVQLTSAGYVARDLGGYAPLMQRYGRVIGNYCLYRHLHYNLMKHCPNGTCWDRRPMLHIRENLRRLLEWRRWYVDGSG